MAAIFHMTFDQIHLLYEEHMAYTIYMCFETQIPAIPIQKIPQYWYMWWTVQFIQVEIEYNQYRCDYLFAFWPWLVSDIWDKLWAHWGISATWINSCCFKHLYHVFDFFCISLSVTQNDFIPVHSLQRCFVANLYGGSICFLIATNMNLYL